VQEADSSVNKKGGKFFSGKKESDLILHEPKPSLSEKKLTDSIKKKKTIE
jgi:hypothetical protein